MYRSKTETSHLSEKGAYLSGQESWPDEQVPGLAYSLRPTEVTLREQGQWMQALCSPSASCQLANIPRKEFTLLSGTLIFAVAAREHLFIV